MATQSQVERAQALAQEEAELRQLAEELLIETEARAEEVKAQFAAQLASIQAESALTPAQTIQEAIAAAQVVETELDLDERETRRLIDAQLREAGWEVDTENLTYRKGARPQKGKNLAIAEWPTTDGRADYSLGRGYWLI